MQVVKIHNTRYAVGLWWQILQGLPSGRGSQIQALGQARRMATTLVNPAYNCAALRKGQYGLGSKRGRIPRVLSLAAALACALKADNANLLTVYLLHSGGPWWVCAIKNGVIAADGDFVCNSLESATAHARQLQEVLAMDAPQIFTDATSSQAHMASLLGKGSWLAGFVGDGRMVSLRSTRRSLRIAGTTVFTLIAMFMLYSLGFFSDDSAMRAAREARRMEILSHPERFFPRPWRENAAPVPWAKRCLKNLFDLSTSDAGWELEQSICRKNDLEAHWNFASGASFLQLPAGASLHSPQKAMQKAALEPLPVDSKNVDLPKREEVARKLYEMANLFGLHLSLTWAQAANRTVREGSLAVPLKAPWQTGKWGFSDLPAQIILSPEFYQVLQSIPGLVLEELIHTNGKWELKGICHGR